MALSKETHDRIGEKLLARIEPLVDDEKDANIITATIEAYSRFNRLAYSGTEPMCTGTEVSFRPHVGQFTTPMYAYGGKNESDKP